MTLAFYRQKISQSLFFQKPLSLPVTHCISTKICLVAKKEVAKEKQNATVIADSPCFLFIMHCFIVSQSDYYATGHKAKDLHNFVVTRKKKDTTCYVLLT